MAIFNTGAIVVIERQDGPQLTGRWAGVEEGMAQLTAAFMLGAIEEGEIVIAYGACAVPMLSVSLIRSPHSMELQEYEDWARSKAATDAGG